MRRRLHLWSFLFVGAGVAFTLADWNRTTAWWLLVGGLVFAVAALLIERRERRHGHSRAGHTTAGAILTVGDPLMRRLLWVWAVVLVGAGAGFAFTGWNRELAPALLLTGILYAVLLIKR